MKSVLLLSMLFASSLSMAGTLTIIPDSTSSMGLEQQRRDLLAQRQAAKQARIAAGTEKPPTVIIIRQAPQEFQKTHFDCRSYGYQNRNISCD